MFPMMNNMNVVISKDNVFFYPSIIIFYYYILYSIILYS